MQELLSSSEAATDWDRVRPVLDDAMRELTEPDREAVLLRYFERRPFADIGSTLHLTEDAARMRVERALEKLRAILTRRGVTTATAVTALVRRLVVFMKNPVAAVAAPVVTATPVMVAARPAGAATIA